MKKTEALVIIDGLSEAKVEKNRYISRKQKNSSTQTYNS